MDFISFEYVFFLLTVTVLFYCFPPRQQWIFLLVASVFFYMLSAPRYIVIPAVIGIVGYGAGFLIEQAKSPVVKKTILLISLVANIGVLVFFKYLNFLITSLVGVVNFFQGHLFPSKALVGNPWTLELVIPLGISYITFQAIGYTIEIYRGRQPAEKNAGYFFTYLMFFPKLFSGPIERAHNFLPQLRVKHGFEPGRVKEGVKLVLWGLFKKLVVAQQLAQITNIVFNSPQAYSGAPVIVAALFFTIQLYADFSGYTDMAIGSANVLGFQLMKNFDFPFIACSTTELWRRWHISLSTWFFEYVYNPLAITMRDWDKWAVVYASLITFLILGLWHGASWKFVILGLLQGMVLSVEFLTKKWRKRVTGRLPPALNDCLGVAITFGFFSFALIFLRAGSFSDAVTIVRNLFLLAGDGGKSSSLFTAFSVPDILTAVFLTGFLLVVEYVDRNFSQVCGEGKGNFLMIFRQNWVWRTCVYALMAYLIVGLGVMKPEQFIYFQF